MHNLFKNLSIVAVAFTIMGCEHHEQKYPKNYNAFKEPQYLFHAKASDLKTNVVNGKDVKTVKFDIQDSKIEKYSAQPKRRTHMVDLDNMVQDLGTQQDHVFAEVSHHKNDEISIAKVHKIWKTGPKSFIMAYDTKSIKPDLMVTPMRDGEVYSVRMSHLLKGEMDAIIVAKEGVTVIPLRDGRFKIIARDFAGLHALENLKTGFVSKFIADIDRLKTFFEDTNQDYGHLNSDMSINGKFVSFQIESFYFNPTEEELAMTVLPLENKDSEMFFDNIKKITTIPGMVKIHIDPIVPHISV